jgi:hypothetical protein
MGKASEETTIQFCPKCGFKPHSGDYFKIASRNDAHSLKITPVDGTEYVCPNCSYKGNIFSIPESCQHNLQFDLEEIEAPVKYAQKSPERFLLYALGFLVILFAIFQTSSLLLAAALSLILIGAIFHTEFSSRAR